MPFFLLISWIILLLLPPKCSHSLRCLSFFSSMLSPWKSWKSGVMFVDCFMYYLLNGYTLETFLNTLRHSPNIFLNENQVWTNEQVQYAKSQKEDYSITTLQWVETYLSYSSFSFWMLPFHSLLIQCIFFVAVVDSNFQRISLPK